MDEIDNCSIMSTLPTAKAMGVDTAAPLSPVIRLTVKTALTPTTQLCLSPKSQASMDSKYSQRSDTPPWELSNRSVRIPVPSPLRSRLDRQYAKRLPVSKGIAPDASIFQPTPIVAPITRTLCSSNLLRSPRQRFFPSFRDDLSGATPTARRTVPVWTASDIGTSDRFLPSRAVSNMNINLWGSMKDRDPVESNSNGRQSAGNTQDASDTLVSQPNMHHILLRSELLGDTLNMSLNDQPRMPGLVAPSCHGVNQLRFHSPRQQAYDENRFNELTRATSAVNSFSLTPVGSSTASQRRMSALQKRRRRIAKVEVWDAPDLQDDFYLNLVDWSSQNVVAVGLGYCVYLLDADTSKVTKLCDLQQNEDLITSVSWAQRGTHLAIGTNRGEVQLWDTIKVEKIRTMTGHSDRVAALAWTGPTLASGGRDCVILLRDVRAQEPYSCRLTTHEGEVCGLKWSFDEPAFLASGGDDSEVHVVEGRKPGSPLHRFSDHTAAVKAIAWSPHQRGVLASGGSHGDGYIRFWNTHNGASLNTVDTASQVCNLAWSQNCNEIVSTHGYDLNQIMVWRFPSLDKVVTLTGHTDRVLYMAVSPDGSTIVTGSGGGDENLRFWEIFPGKNRVGGLLFPNTLGSVIR